MGRSLGLGVPASERGTITAEWAWGECLCSTSVVDKAFVVAAGMVGAVRVDVPTVRKISVEGEN